MAKEQEYEYEYRIRRIQVYYRDTVVKAPNIETAVKRINNGEGTFAEEARYQYTKHLDEDNAIVISIK